VTELQTATVDLMSGIDVIRNTQTRVPGAHYARVAAVVLSALGSVFAAASPATTADPRLRDLLQNWRFLPPFIDRLLEGDQQVTDAHRRIAVDLSTMLLPRTTRFFAAATTLMSGPEEWQAEATGALMNAVGALLGAIDPSRDRKYQQARKEAERALGTFQRTIREHGAKSRARPTAALRSVDFSIALVRTSKLVIGPDAAVACVRQTGW